MSIFLFSIVEPIEETIEKLDPTPGSKRTIPTKRKIQGLHLNLSVV